MDCEVMDREVQDNGSSDIVAHYLARRVLVAFVLTFLTARMLVGLMMSGLLPDMFLSVRGTHVHHMFYGIVMLTGVGGYLLFGQPAGRGLARMASVYGIGLGLTFDEFGMWLHLDDTYWQRGSFDAVVLIAGGLCLVSLLPTFKRLRPRRWAAGVVLGVGMVLLVLMMTHSYRYAHQVILPRMQVLETMRATERSAALIQGMVGSEVMN